MVIAKADLYVRIEGNNLMKTNPLLTITLKAADLSLVITSVAYTMRSKTLNKFTLIIHGRGWLVGDACDYWGIRYATYNARCNNPKMFNQLECMCRGLEGKQ